MAAEHVDPPRILIVEDNPANVDVLIDQLAGAGFTIMVAEDGEEALERSQYKPPDLILLDVLLPGIDGFETCRRLKADDRTRTIPVIFITALTDLADKICGFATGGVDFVTKPLQEQEVLARVKTHLALRQLQQQSEAQNAQLQQEIAVREQVEAELQRARAELEPPTRFVGFDNFTRLFRDTRLLQALKNAGLFELAAIGDILGLQRQATQLAQRDAAPGPFARKLVRLAGRFEAEQALTLIARYL